MRFVSAGGSSFPWRAVSCGALLVLFLAGCASSALVNMWRDPAAPTGPLDRIYVVAMKREPARRRIMEDAFATALGERSVTAGASYRDFPAGLPDTLEVAERVRAGGYDAVLVISNLDTRTVQTYVPGYMTTRTYTGWNRWTGRYETFVREVESPGFVETDEVVRHQVDLWSTTEDGHLIWTATGNSLNPNSTQRVTRQLVRRVLGELEEQGFLPG